MTNWILENEITIRIIAFASILLTMMLLEGLLPRRKRLLTRIQRWIPNLAIVFINSAILRFIFPLAAAGLAALAVEKQWGLFNQYELPHAFTIIISVVLLDMAIYLQHVMFHAVPAFWRLHRLHHADLDYDVTTGARFHPVEIVLSMLIKLSIIVVLGPPVVAVVIFEVLLNATAMFNHANVKLPPGLDRVLRLLVVTPDMHRVHHSIIPRETNSNFGFNLPWWDRLFGTYRAQPVAGHEGMTIGLTIFRKAEDTRLDKLLIQPFITVKSNYSITDTSDSAK